MQVTGKMTSGNDDQEAAPPECRGRRKEYNARDQARVRAAEPMSTLCCPIWPGTRRSSRGDVNIMLFHRLARHAGAAGAMSISQCSSPLSTLRLLLTPYPPLRPPPPAPPATL